MLEHASPLIRLFGQRDALHHDASLLKRELAVFRSQRERKPVHHRRMLQEDQPVPKKQHSKARVTQAPSNMRHPTESNQVWHLNMTESSGASSWFLVTDHGSQF